MDPHGWGRGGVGWGGKRVGEGWGLLVSRPADQITAAIGSSGSMRGQSQPSWVRLGKSVPALMDKNHLHLNVTFLPQPETGEEAGCYGNVDTVSSDICMKQTETRHSSRAEEL